MAFIYPWIFFAFIPLYLFYKKNSTKHEQKRQTKLLYLSMAFIFLALGRPVLEDSFTNEKFDAQEYIIAIDASFSMQAQDLKPSRYAVAKEAIKKLLALHPKDRFSLFAFTSNPLLISPPTTDTAITLSALDALNPAYILTKSTNIHSLLLHIAKSSYERKKMIIFSDGGDEHNINSLLQIAKKANIELYIVATATKKGSALRKDGYLIKDHYSSIVISRINPILKDLAKRSGGEYYELSSNKLNPINKLSDDLSVQNTRSETIAVKKYKELNAIPLIIAILLFFLAITKLHQLYVIIPLLLLPQVSKAEIFDFYHLKSAKSAYAKKEYLNAAKEFEKVSPSVAAAFNTATAYYKAAHYKKALEIFSSIETPNATIKQQCFYAMGNIAVKLKRYDRAKNYYIQALTLGEDSDALYNLNLLHRLQLKTGVNLIDMLPEKNAQTKKNSSKSTSQQKDEKKQSGAQKNSNRSAQSSDGAGESSKPKKESQKSSKQAVQKEQKNSYKMAYKSYELINKGYTNEKEPW